MGKGDKKSKKGKIFQHSFGKTRKRKKGRLLSSRKKFETKTKPVEHKKPIKPESEIVKPAVVFEPKVADVRIEKPVVTEIKEEVKLPEIKEQPIYNIPEAVKESVKKEIKSEESVNKILKSAPVQEKLEIKEVEKELPKPKSKTEEPAPVEAKKRGRPKKKKEE
jgi:ribosomal small subunit protein bTHX